MSYARKMWLFGPPLVYCALIFGLSHQPVLPATPGGDKTAHVLAYAIMGMLFVRAFYFGTEWSVRLLLAVAFAVSALYGVSDEFHQSFVPGRVASAADVLADTVGAFLGTGFAYAGLRASLPRR